MIDPLDALLRLGARGKIAKISRCLKDDRVCIPVPINSDKLGTFAVSYNIYRIKIRQLCWKYQKPGSPISFIEQFQKSSDLDTPLSVGLCASLDRHYTIDALNGMAHYELDYLLVLIEDLRYASAVAGVMYEAMSRTGSSVPTDYTPPEKFLKEPVHRSRLGLFDENKE